MASSPPGSPPPGPRSRPASAMIRLPRSSSRMSISSKAGGGSRASDEDGKTSVRVAVRVRPPLKPTDPGYELIPQRFQRSMVQVLSQTSLAIDSPQGKKVFVFDRVFGEDVDQQGIWDYLQESIASFVQGYNVSLLAYGQSGAGKSYTMGTSGPAEQSDSDVMGIIPRAATALFEKLGSSPSSKRESMSGLRAPTRYSTPVAQLRAEKTWTMKATYVEIYNEQLRDLLLPESTPVSERPVVSIREDAKGRILLTGLHQVEINSVEDLIAALNHGSAIRQTDATAINAKSSRSHAVFSLNLIQKRPKPPAGPTSPADKRMSMPVELLSNNHGDGLMTIDSKLHFVDLAGSERLKNTGAHGERAKEGISINAGLASLGKVISQLSSRQAGAHVSYRDSKLTRLLQDSLGGNAITYMVACVTPAEFHLSETLNTVQYAQRARAIQSKPRIQATSDDSDKQAVIDRLRAEVTFLREQIRNLDRSDRRSAVPQERHERQNEREIELQNTLLDTQENYTALSQRYTKLIAEIAKARDAHGPPTPTVDDHTTDTAGERIKRSNFFAQEVDKVLLEYEKTIQTLESSLTSTRGHLSASESSLLEKETKLAYMDTVNSQLQSRLQKMMDRENSTESYLHDLEGKLDAHTSGEEKSAAVITKLRTEIARIRENEAACEDYISTLEERLAEADQDAELMQRELERLEHVVERQRSLGKLDNLLYELDHMDGVSKRSSSRNASRPTTSHGLQHPTVIEEEQEQETPIKASTIELSEKALKQHDEFDYPQPSPAQSQFVNDKLEVVTQELLGLRAEHDTTLQDYEHLALKYDEALRTLAELQDAVDEARHSGHDNQVLSPASTRPTSFLEDQRISGLRDEQQSSSRSLSSELSLAGELGSSSTEATEVFEGEQTAISRAVQDDVARGPARKDASALVAEIEGLRKLQAEKDEQIVALQDQYSKLEEEHEDIMEELKTEVHKNKMLNNQPNGSNVIRRKSSQGVMVLDRAHRSFASLKNIAAENLEANPDAHTAFETHLNTAMHELHSRSERIQELETQIDNTKKEMETKVAIISGLTRERSSIKQASPIDVSVVSSMQERIVESEKQLQEMRDQHASREEELHTRIAALQTSLETQTDLHEQSAREFDAKYSMTTEEHQKAVDSLNANISELSAQHQSAIEQVKVAEAKHLDTLQKFEEMMGSMELLQGQHETTSKDLTTLKTEREQQESHISDLTRSIEEHQNTITAHIAEISNLKDTHSASAAEMEKSATSAAETHSSVVADMHKELGEHRDAIVAHEKRIKDLHSAHATELENLRSNITAEAEARIAEHQQQHDAAMTAINGRLAESRDTLVEHQTRLAKIESAALDSEKIIEELEAERHAIKEASMSSDDATKQLQADLERVTEEGKKHLDTINELKQLNEETIDEMKRLAKKDEKNSRIIEELENELSSTFDQHQKTNNRLSSLQTERNRALEEAQGSIETMKEEILALQAKLGQVAPESPQRASAIAGRTSSMTSTNLRKSPSSASLPSPPPAIPLPPLPGSGVPSISTVVQTGQQAAQPPTPTMSRRPSKDLATSQLAEDQEARLRTIEKHLYAEKQLTATLEEALTDLEQQGKKVEVELLEWKKKYTRLEDENERLKTQSSQSRYSIQAVEEERIARREAETARAHLEERMNQINKKKGRTLMCF